MEVDFNENRQIKGLIKAVIGRKIKHFSNVRGNSKHFKGADVYIVNSITEAKGHLWNAKKAKSSLDVIKVYWRSRKLSFDSKHLCE